MDAMETLEKAAIKYLLMALANDKCSVPVLQAAVAIVLRPK